MTKDWEPQKEEIRKLYVLEQKPLAQVMRIIEGRHRFIASERAYRDQLKKWGYMKNRTQNFPKPKKRRHPSTQSGRRPVPSLPNLETFGMLQGEASLPGNLSTFSTFDTTHNNLHFAIPRLSAAGVPESQPNGLDQEIQGPGLFQPDQNAQDEQGTTQLHRAALNKDIEQVRLLLNAGAAVDIRDHTSNTPLHNAVTAESIEIALLILRFGADVDAKNHRGRAPLHLAISQPGVINALVDNGADVSIQDEKGDTPLHLVLSTDPATNSSTICSTAVMLLKSGGDPNKKNNAEVTPFLKLLDRSYDQSGVRSAICSFLEAGGSTEQTLPDGRTPFQIFLSRSDNYGFKIRGDDPRLENTILRYFLGKGASVVTLVSHREPLILNYCRQLYKYYHPGPMDETLAKELFKGITTDEAKKVGDSLLSVLVEEYGWHKMEGRGKLARILLRHGVNPNHENLKGETPLILLFGTFGLDSGTAEILASLLEHGADPWQRDYSGTCALFLTAEKKYNESCRTILGEDLRRKQSALTSETEPRNATRSQVWDEWQEAARAADWSVAKQLALPQSEDLSREAKKTLRDCAFGVLAENHIRLAKDKFQGEAAGTELRRKYVAGIMRDCKERDITLDASCMDYLVELCLE
ncbi:hypothetical protein CEP54_005298 [Fusarium duplospermum]|uniref:Clr5 domain-containing protein n=1 Tax=Fusarium duplospermum TaxID=1325734 RepID=A0A428QD60_9HYPO|nr:hypothetical protein CEP54_005298 [Fusarium duplospermum]